MIVSFEVDDVKVRVEKTSLDGGETLLNFEGRIEGGCWVRGYPTMEQIKLVILFSDGVMDFHDKLSKVIAAQNAEQQ